MNEIAFSVGEVVYFTMQEDWDPPGSLYVHRRNLFHHIGRVSTESVKNSDEFRDMYHALREDECWQGSF